MSANCLMVLSGSDCVRSGDSIIGEDARMGILTHRDLVKAETYLRDFCGLSPVVHTMNAPGNNVASGVFLDRAPAAHVLVCHDFLSAVQHDNGMHDDIETLLYRSLSILWCDSHRVYRGRTVATRGQGEVCIGNMARVGTPDTGEGTVYDSTVVGGFYELNGTFTTMLKGKGSHLSWHLQKYDNATQCSQRFAGSDIGTWGMARIFLGAPKDFSVPIQFQWWYNGLPIGARCAFQCRHGTLILMDGDYAFGRNWRKQNEVAMRNALGDDEKYVPCNAKIRELIRARRRRLRMEPISEEEELARLNAARTAAHFKDAAIRKRAESYDADVDSDCDIRNKKRSRKRVRINTGANISITLAEVDERIVEKSLKRAKK